MRIRQIDDDEKIGVELIPETIKDVAELLYLHRHEGIATLESDRELGTVCSRITFPTSETLKSLKAK